MALSTREGTMTAGRVRRVLIAIDSLRSGGAERIAAQLATELSKSGGHIRFVMTHDSNKVWTLPEEIELIELQPARPPRADAEPHSDGMLDAARSLWREVTGLHKQVREFDPDCVVTFLPHTTLVALLSRFIFRFSTPIVCEDHCLLRIEIPRMPFPRIRTWLTRRFYKSAALHVAVSRDESDDLQSLYGVAAEQIVIIPNGVDIEEVRQRAASPLESSEPERGEAVRIVAVGRLTRAKAFDVLLQAMQQIADRNWQLVLVGDGEESESLKSLAGQLGIADRVHFTGWESNPYRWMSRSDVFVLSSRWEAMPSVLLEALALGLPIVATTCSSACSEVLDAGQYGLLVEKENPSALAEALASLIDAPELRSRLAAAARQRAPEFAVSRTTERHEAVLDEISRAGR
jgi:glycosyltransferase involved in cell wall biosynthesis